MTFFERFTKMVAEERLPALFLFSGPKSSGKREEAMRCAKMLLRSEQETHVDLHQYYPEGKTGMHNNHAIKNLCHEIYLSAHAGGYKCFIIHHAERMLPSNANALLKTFEEPSEKTVIFLLTTKLSLILPTIVSRAQSITFHRDKQTSWSERQRAFVKLLAERSVQEIVDLGELLDKERKEEESEGVKAFPKEMTPQQKERLMKEVEGRGTLAYQEKREEIFEAALAFYRDIFFFHHKAPLTELFFPEFEALYKIRRPMDLDLIEQKIERARKAHDRGVKLSHCLEELL